MLYSIVVSCNEICKREKIQRPPFNTPL
jgi:hypothetical protein